jgi:catechol 2,3-dioxygenase-like lactoylglutathione lyase family enzyme
MIGMIEIKGLHIALPVNDVRETVDFYRTLFGMEVLYSTQYYDRTFVMMGLGDHRISFVERPESIPHPPWVSRSGENPLHIGFVVSGPDEIDNALQECKRRGVKVIIEPRDRLEVGERAVYCLDPTGYQVEVYCEKIGHLEGDSQ